MRIDFYNRDGNGIWLEKVGEEGWWQLRMAQPSLFNYTRLIFEEEDIDLELILTSGADKVSAAVLSGDVNIGFAGPESAIYVYQNGEEDYLVTFAGLTKRDGQFIVSRKKLDSFNVEDLYNKEKFHILTKEEYVDIVIDQLELLRPEIVIHRITGDPKISDLVEPDWLIKKVTILNDIDKEMVKRADARKNTCLRTGTDAKIVQTGRKGFEIF